MLRGFTYLGRDHELHVTSYLIKDSDFELGLHSKSGMILECLIDCYQSKKLATNLARYYRINYGKLIIKQMQVVDHDILDLRHLTAQHYKILQPVTHCVKHKIHTINWIGGIVTIMKRKKEESIQ